MSEALNQLDLGFHLYPELPQGQRRGYRKDLAGDVVPIVIVDYEVDLTLSTSSQPPQLGGVDFASVVRVEQGPETGVVGFPGARQRRVVAGRGALEGLKLQAEGDEAFQGSLGRLLWVRLVGKGNPGFLDEPSGLGGRWYQPELCLAYLENIFASTATGVVG